MDPIKNWIATFKEARRGHRHRAAFIFASIVAVGGYILSELVVLPEGSQVTIPWSLVPAGVAFLVLALFHYCWLLEYANRKRLELAGVTNLEKILDVLSDYLEEGNNEILNKPVSTDAEFTKWKNSEQVWRKKVERYLKKNFGKREMMSFRHIVILEYKLLEGSNPEIIKRRNIVAWKLLAIKEILLRYSERASKWRAASTSA